MKANDTDNSECSRRELADGVLKQAERDLQRFHSAPSTVGDLMKRGVHVELCGATAKVHHWGNADLIPGIKINTDAMARITQLVQEGFVKISES